MPSKNLIPLENLQADAIAALHSRCLRNVLSSLGDAVIRQYYHAALRCGWCVGFAWINGPEIEGVVYGSIEPNKVWADVIRVGGRSLWLALLKSLLRKPIRVMSLIRAITSGRGESLGGAELIYLFVSPEAQGHGIGRELMIEFASEVRRRGLPSYHLCVWDNNRAAMHLYTSQGLQLRGRFRWGLEVHLQLEKTFNV